MASYVIGSYWPYAKTVSWHWLRPVSQLPLNLFKTVNGEMVKFCLIWIACLDVICIKWENSECLTCVLWSIKFLFSLFWTDGVSPQLRWMSCHAQWGLWVIFTTSMYSNRSSLIDLNERKFLCHHDKVIFLVTYTYIIPDFSYVIGQGHSLT